MTEKTKKPRIVNSRVKGENLAQMSSQITLKAMDVLIHMIDAGRSNFVQGIVSSVIVSDMLHSAGLLSDPANAGITLLLATDATLTEAESLFGIFSSAADVLKPTLTTDVSQNNEEKSDSAQKPSTKPSTTDRVAKSAQQLTSLIPAIVAAGA
jgi:hypothetical protein